MHIKQTSGYHEGPDARCRGGRQDRGRRATLTWLPQSAGNAADRATREGERPGESLLNRGKIFIAGNTSLNTSFRERHGKNTRSWPSGKTR